MIYFGGKQRLGKHIAKFILSVILKTKYRKAYLEPFCGALGVMQNIVEADVFEKHYAYDIQPDLILMWNGLKRGTFKPPRTMAKSTWLKLKNQKRNSALRAFAGFGISFNGIFFSSYAYKKNTDIPGAAYRSLMKIKPLLKRMNFKRIDYSKIKTPRGYVIYCDPPYKFDRTRNTYDNFSNFDHEKFWEIMRKWSKHNLVFISEESTNAPKDFKCIWKYNVKRTMGTHTNTTGKKTKQVYDCLFIYKFLEKHYLYY